jgi:excisionase family DNA binding protein
MEVRVMSKTLHTAQPDADDVAVAQHALVSLRKVLSVHPNDEMVALKIEETGEELTLPRFALDLLVRVLANVAAGHGVTMVPRHAELTTQQAADLLNVSRPFLIRLLDDQKIEYKLVGSHRRIKASSLEEFRRRDDAQRREAAGELASLTQEMGLA